MQYRRLKFPGGCYFFTVVTHDRQPLFSNAENVELLRAAIRYVKTRHPFKIQAVVILPDHIHCIWKLPPEDHAFSMRWRLIKERFTKHCRAAIRGAQSLSRKQKHEQAVWQRRFWEHLIKSDDDFANHVNYIHWNPVKHGYVTAPEDWPFSSSHYFVKMGKMELGASKLENLDFGVNTGME